MQADTCCIMCQCCRSLVLRRNNIHALKLLLTQFRVNNGHAYLSIQCTYDNRVYATYAKPLLVLSLFAYCWQVTHVQ